jgi:hypothetical protein
MILSPDCRAGLNQKFDAPRSLCLATFTIFSKLVHNLSENLSCGSTLFSTATAMRIGAVARLKLRMLRWLFVAGLVVSHFSLLV